MTARAPVAVERLVLDRVASRVTSLRALGKIAVAPERDENARQRMIDAGVLAPRRGGPLTPMVGEYRSLPLDDRGRFYAERRVAKGLRGEHDDPSWGQPVTE